MTQKQNNQFQLGTFRPLYLWGGGATARMTRLKFMNAGVDEKIYDLAHSIEGAERVAEMGFNWVFLAYNWGFPPEAEEQDWESFYSALNHYHKAGVKVFGYIQSSNCVYAGSYIDKDWYALDYYGQKISYYTGRYFTSMSHAGWLAEVRERVRQLTEAGADGIFFDNPWQGGIAMDLAEMPLGFVGSYDTFSKKAYTKAYPGAEIPLVWDFSQAETQQYLRWRARTSVNAVRDWAQTARDINSDVVITANNFDAIVRNAYATMGMDLEALADVQDVVMVENFSLPRLQDDDSVVANAITMSATQARIAETPVTTNPYIQGVGFDRVWQPRQFKRMLAEGIAMNAPIVVRGTTFAYRQEYTLLLHRRYEKQRDVLQQFNQWLVQHQDWISERQPVSPIAVYDPADEMRWQWNKIAPHFFAVCQTLLLNGYPLRIVGDNDDWRGVKTLIVPPNDNDRLDERLENFVETGGRLIAVGKGRKASRDSAVWYKWQPIPHRIPRWRWLRKRINHGAILSWRAYHRSKTVRWLAERFEFHTKTIQSPLFFVPPEKYQKELLSALGNQALPHVESEYPVLLSGWEEPDGTQQWHIMNYGDSPQKITLELDRLVKATLYAVGEEKPVGEVVGSSLMMTVDIAKIVRIPPAQ